MADAVQLDKRPFSPLNVLKGTFIGMANIIPGVSGGTIAVIVGIYDELVDALGSFFSGEGGWRRNTSFLAPVILGVLLGNIALARLIGFLLQTAPGPASFGFIGLILGSTPYMLGRAGLRRMRIRHGLLFAAGLGVVLWMGLASRPAVTPPITAVDLQAGIILFGAAVAGSIAMMIPGVSGSFLHLLMGTYSTMQHAFSTLNAPIVLLFVAGTLTGVVLVSKAVALLLRSFHSSTYAVVIGLVIGSTIALFPGFSGGAMVVADIGAFILGLLLSLLLGTGTKERMRGTPPEG